MTNKPSRRYVSYGATLNKKRGSARDPERTREALVKAAEKIVVEKGIEAMTLEEVAAAASVSKGGLLHHFPSKKALVLGIAQDMIRQYDLAIAGYQQKDPVGPGAFTRAFLRANLECADESAQLCNALVSDMRAYSGPLDLFRQHSVHCQTRIENDGLDPAAASIVRYAGEGLMASAMWGMPRPTHYDEVIEALLAMATGDSQGSKQKKASSANRTGKDS